MSIPLVQEATKDAINTSIIAIKRNIERINMLLGLVDSGSPDLSGLATKQELEDAITQVETDLAPVDEVTSGNMQSVTSNAVAEVIAGTLKPETQAWSDNHSYTLKREGKYLLFCTNPNNQGTGVYFVLGRHRTNTSLVGYAETIKSSSVTYNVSVSGDTLRITGNYCITNLIFISDV